MKKLNNILPLDLKEIFDSLEYENGALSIDSVQYFDEELLFNFTLHSHDYNNDNMENQSWQLEVQGYRDSKIDINDIGNFFSFYSDHFLLCGYSHQSVPPNLT